MIHCRLVGSQLQEINLAAAARKTNPKAVAAARTTTEKNATDGERAKVYLQKLSHQKSLPLFLLLLHLHKVHREKVEGKITARQAGSRPLVFALGWC